MDTTDKDKNGTRKAAKGTTIKPPFSPYDVVIIGLDEHPGIAADVKADPAAGITAKDAERRRKLYVQLFDERATMPLDPGLLASVEAHGVQQPIKYIMFDGVPYAINGRQRLRAARVVHDKQTKLGLEPGQFITVDGDEYKGNIDQLFALSRILNINVAEPTMMKARSMMRLLMEDIVDKEDTDAKARKRTVQEVAAIYGCSDQHVRDMTKLFESNDTVKRALEELKQPTIGLLLTGLVKEDGTPDEEKQLKVLEELKTEQKGGAKVTVARARKKVAEAKGKQVNSPKDKVDTIQRLLQKLADKSSEASCTSCKTQAEAQAALALVLATLDGVARAAFGGGKVAFPTPIAKQKPGYTLDVIAAIGD